jgi:hypothetical protein
MTEFVGHSISGGAATFRYAAAKAELLADRKAVEEALDAEEQNTGSSFPSSWLSSTSGILFRRHGFVTCSRS